MINGVVIEKIVRKKIVDKKRNSMLWAWIYIYNINRKIGCIGDQK